MTIPGPKSASVDFREGVGDPLDAHKGALAQRENVVGCDAEDIVVGCGDGDIAVSEREEVRV